MRVFLWGLVVLSMLVSPAAAEDSPLKTLVTANDARGFEAVGRIVIAGHNFCTGALVAPQQVLTAAHCVFDERTGRRHQPRDIRFYAGWRNGRANAEASVARIAVDPDYHYTGVAEPSAVAEDLALLELSQPIRKSSVVPLGIGPRPRKGAEVGVVSYAQGREMSPSLQRLCHVLARRGATLMLSCDVDFGSSGAPVFTLDQEGRPQIVAVISAKADVRGIPVALSARVQERLEILKGELGAAAPVVPSAPRVRVLTSGGNTGGGAKFVRP